MAAFGDEMEPPLELTKLCTDYYNSNLYPPIQPKQNEDDASISLGPHSISSPHICAGCEKPILDEFLSSVLNQWWHESCLKCAECGIQLSETCYSRNGKTFCREDFYRRFAPRCSGCVETFRPTDLVRKARDHYFHVNCFTCFVCRRELNTGDQLLICGNKAFICKQDYLAGNFGSMLDYVDEDEDEEEDDDEDDRLVGDYSSAENSIKVDFTNIKNTSNNKSNEESRNMGSSTHSGLRNDGMGLQEDINVSQMKNDSRFSMTDFENNNESEAFDDNEDKYQDRMFIDKDDPNGTKRRGPRTTIKAKQLEVLKTAFNQTPKPTRHIREQLAKETGLTMRVIQVWFQNKRSKERRMKQMCGRGKFFMAPGMSSPGGKLRKYDDNRFFFYEGGAFGPPYGPQFPSTDLNFASASRNQLDPSGSISSMEQHVPMRMSMLGGGPLPPVNSAQSISLTDEEYSNVTAASTTGSPNVFIPPSQLLPTDPQTGAETETDILLPNIHTKHEPLMDEPM